MHLVDHCNLNCKSCSHYCPLIEASERSFLSLGQFKSDIFELAKKIRIKRIRLLGGEPLLHPNIADFLPIVRAAFSKSDIRIVTNGILLPQMTKSFWEAVRINKIKIDMSKYPPQADNFDLYLNLILENGCELGGVKDINEFFSFLNLEGNCDKNKPCIDMYCTILRDGKLHTCPQVCYIDYFKTNLPKEDGIDIYKNSGKEIIKYVYSPRELCRYCVGTLNEDNKKTQWEISKRDIKEWQTQ